MKERPLAFNHVPVLWRRIGTEHLRRARLEIGHHRIHRHAAAGDQDAGLPGCAEVDRAAACLECPRNCKGRVLLAERTVGADGEQALAAALAASGDRDVGGGTRTSMRRRPRRAAAADRLRHIAQAWRAARSPDRAPPPEPPTSSGTQRSLITPPTLATPMTSPRAPRARASVRRKARQPGGDRGFRAPPLADAAIGYPVTQPEGRLGERRLGRIAEEQQIRIRQARGRCRLLRPA